MPSNPDASTNALAERPKVSLVEACAATLAKL